MGTIGSILILIIILGVIISIHEFGHFITAKKSGVYVYEFSLGFGPRLFKFTRKNDVTEYSIRAIPLGGYVSMAGETSSQEEGKKVKKSERLCNKRFSVRMLVILAGIINNFLLAIVILFISALIFGAPETRPILYSVEEGAPAYEAGLQKGDIITNFNGKKIRYLEDISLELALLDGENEVSIEYTRDGKTNSVKLTPEKYTNEYGSETYKLGVTTGGEKQRGIIPSIKYTYNKFVSLLGTMNKTIAYLFTGKAKMNQLSGPVGIYTIVDKTKGYGLQSILLLIALLSVNVGVVNLIPIPVFDGGRALLIIIEKLKGSKISEKVETILDYIGLVLMVALMIYVTINDIFRLFK